MRIGYYNQVIGLDRETNQQSFCDRTIDYNLRNNISVFELCSQELDFSVDKLTKILKLTKENNLRLMISQSLTEDSHHQLKTITDMLDSINLDLTNKIVMSAEYFLEHNQTIPASIRHRLAVKSNKDCIEEVLDLSKCFNIPVSYSLTKDDKTNEWIDRCLETWTKTDGPPLIYSHFPCQEGIVDSIVEFVSSLQFNEVDVLLQNNLCCKMGINSLSEKTTTVHLEQEWSLYKYSILEKSQTIYQHIRQLLKDKKNNNVLAFYHLIEEGLLLHENKGQAINALQHVWGYFKKVASIDQKHHFLNLVDQYHRDEVSLKIVKNYLKALASQYKESYLLKSLYFDL